MAARSTGWAMLFGNSVQEVMDLALIAQASTLEARVPFLHIFDGFRTSHEVAKIEKLDDEDMRAMIDDELVHAHRARALTPDRRSCAARRRTPMSTSRRARAQPYYACAAGIVQKTMDKFAGCPAASIICSTTCRRARCRARDRDDGVRRRGRRETVAAGCSPRREGRRWSRCASSAPSRCSICRGAAAT
jgi:hypothetical protein